METGNPETWTGPGHCAEGDDKLRNNGARWEFSLQASFGRQDMANGRAVAISPHFETRETADRAMKLFVQQHGLQRRDIFDRPATDDNRSGSRPAGGDASHEHAAREDAPLAGEVHVCVAIALAPVSAASRIFCDLGAMRVERFSP